MHEDSYRVRQVYDGHLLELNVHDVRLPDGGESVREIITHPGAVGVVAVDADNCVLLVRQYRLAVDAITHELPAGILEADETPRACASRELREEVGLKPLNLQAIGGLHTAPGYTDEYIHLFYATEFEHAPLPQDDDEMLDVVRVPFDEALKMIEQGDINEAKTICGLLRVARLRQTESGV
jgi:ADP-ribose pyrophosphatase